MDLCCGLTMIGILRNIFTEDSVHMQEVPFLVCPTCLQSKIAPPFEFDFSMYSYHCATDRVQYAVFSDAVGIDRITHFLDQYPIDERVSKGIRVTQQQIDPALDMILFLQSQGESEWLEEWKDKLRFFHQVMAASYSN